MISPRLSLLICPMGITTLPSLEYSEDSVEFRVYRAWHIVGAEQILAPTLSSFPRKQRGSGSWLGASFRKDQRGRSRDSPVFRAQNGAEISRLSYCLGVMTAAVFARLFDNVNLATALYYNTFSHTEVALAPYSP